MAWYEVTWKKCLEMRSRRKRNRKRERERRRSQVVFSGREMTCFTGRWTAAVQLHQRRSKEHLPFTGIFSLLSLFLSPSLFFSHSVFLSFSLFFSISLPILSSVFVVMWHLFLIGGNRSLDWTTKLFSFIIQSLQFAKLKKYATKVESIILSYKIIIIIILTESLDTICFFVSYGLSFCYN